MQSQLRPQDSDCCSHEQPSEGLALSSWESSLNGSSTELEYSRSCLYMYNITVMYVVITFFTTLEYVIRLPWQKFWVSKTDSMKYV
jgi:hypothetical protein